MSKGNVIARPYAKAVFELASATHTLDAWAKMLSIAAYVVKDHQVAGLLKNPAVTTEWLVETIVAVDPAAFTDQGQAFLRLIGKLKRWAMLPAILHFFEALRSAALGVCRVHVTVAHALTSEQQAMLAQALSRHVGKQLDVTYKTDATILGGAVIRIGDQCIDGSARGRLNRLAETLNVTMG